MPVVWTTARNNTDRSTRPYFSGARWAINTQIDKIHSISQLLSHGEKEPMAEVKEYGVCREGLKWGEGLRGEVTFREVRKGDGEKVAPSSLAPLSLRRGAHVCSVNALARRTRRRGLGTSSLVKALSKRQLPSLVLGVQVLRSTALSILPVRIPGARGARLRPACQGSRHDDPGTLRSTHPLAA